MVNVKTIILLSAYHAASHRYWCEGLVAAFPGIEWKVYSLPARHFAWRIRGNPLSFLQAFPELDDVKADLVLATSMVDLACFKAVFPHLAQLPSILYFHENQFAYPLSGNQADSVEAQMVNLYSACAADKLVFNSEFNRLSFLQGVKGLMQKMPDYAPTDLHKMLHEKSQVLPVPLKESSFMQSLRKSSLPSLVWNHRWEYDKGPELLLAVMREIEHRQLGLSVSIIGQQFRQQPRAFDEIQKILENSFTLECRYWGYIEGAAEYHQCLASHDLVLSTALHDFQGLSILEAVSAGCVPVVPDHLVYPEYFDDAYRYAFKPDDLGSTARHAVDLIETMIARLKLGENLAPSLEYLAWPNCHARYAQLLGVEPESMS